MLRFMYLTYTYVYGFKENRLAIMSRPFVSSFYEEKGKKQMKYFIYIWKLFDTGKASKVYSCLVHSKEEYFHLTNALFFMLN